MQSQWQPQRNTTRQAREAGGKALAKGGAQIGELFDIEDSLKHSIKGFSDMESGPALVLGVLFLLLTIALSGMVIIFDLIPTMQFSLAKTAAFLPASAAGFGGVAGVLLTLVPSLIEMLAPSLLKRGIKVSYLPVLGAMSFDAISDLPACQAFIGTMQPLFEAQFGAAAGVVHNMGVFLWLMCATIGFELLAVISFSATAQLLWQSQRHSRAKYQGPAGMGMGGGR